MSISLRNLLTAAGLALATSLAGCLIDSQAKGGHVVENEVQAGTLYVEGGVPAVGARVRIYPVGYLPHDGILKKRAADSAVVVTLVTDSMGRYYVDSLAQGQYNIAGESGGALSFLDSVTIGYGADSIPSDTLEAPGSIALRVQLEPNHDRRRAYIQVLGTDRFAAADSAGNILLATMGPGRYSYRLSTTLDGYVPLFGSFVVRSGVDDTLASVLRPEYTDIPAVRGLSATYDTARETVSLHWAPAHFGFLKEYLIFRSEVSDLMPPLLPIAKTIDTFFVDSLLPQASTTSPKYEYRVRIRSLSDDVGAVFGSVTLAAPGRDLVKTSLNFGLVPTAGGESPTTVGMGDSVAVEVRWSNSTRRNVSLLWLDSDGKPLSDTLARTSRDGADTLRTAAPIKPGPWIIGAIARDEAGGIWQGQIILQVLRDAPFAKAGKDTTVSVGDRVDLSGTGRDSLGQIVLREWDIDGDGSFTVVPGGDTSILAPAVPGIHRHVFRVTDDDGNTGLDTVMVSVLLDAPVADAGADTSVTLSDTLRLADRSRDGFGRIVKREWDLGGRGVFQETPSGAALTVTRNATGIETHILRVTDDDGNTALDTLRVTVFNDLPRVSLSYHDRIEAQGGGYTLRASASDRGRIVKYEWNIGGTGTWVAASRADTSFLPADPAETKITCRIRVTDEDGNSAVGETIFTVSKWKVVGWPEKPYTLDDRTRASMVALDGKLYIARNGVNIVTTFDPATRTWGELQGRLPTGLEPWSQNSFEPSLAVVEGALHVVTGQTAIYFYDGNLGLWTERVPANRRRSFPQTAVVGSHLFVKSRGLFWGDNDPLEEFDLSSGLVKTPGTATYGNDWSWTTLSAGQGILYAFATNLSAAYDPVTGIWKDHLKVNDYSAETTVYLGGKLYLISRTQQVMAYDPATRSLLKRSFVPYVVPGMAATVLNGKIYLLGRDGILQSYDPADEP